MVSDDIDGDGRCDSTIVTSILAKKWTELSHGGSLNQIDSNQRAKDEWYALTNDATIKEKLKRIFYKFPTEWSMTDFDTRYAWVKKDIYENAEKSFEKFKNFAQALSFWDEAGIPIDKNHWHFPPIEFIKHFRKCGWLSKNEIKQLIPKSIVSAVGTHYVFEGNNNANLVNNIYINLNKMMRKYCITTPLRMCCFFGNSIQETIWLSTLSELWPKTRWYYPWSGRGLLQLTHPGNYKQYWVFRGWTVSKEFNNFINGAYKTANSTRSNVGIQDAKFPALSKYQGWRDKVEDGSIKDPCDSAGFYWALYTMAFYADAPHKLEDVSVSISKSRRKTDLSTIVGNKVYYRSISFWKASAAVNYPGGSTINNTQYKGINGFVDRCAAYKSCLVVLTELKFPDGNNQKIETPKDYTARPISS